MDPASWIRLVLQAGIALTVFALGLGASAANAAYLTRRPGLLLRSLLSMNVVMPLLAAAMVAAFDLDPAVKVALITLAVSPVPPMLPGRALKAGGDPSYVIGLLVVAALLAVLFVPVAVDLMVRMFGAGSRVPFVTVAKVVAATVLAPLAAGSLFRRVAPAASERIAKPASLVASALLIAGVVPVLFTAMPEIVSLIGDGTLVAIAAFVAAGLAVGHMLGGPEPDDRTVLALVTSSRHPGVAVAIAAAMFPGEKAIAAAILLYLIVNAIVSIAYQAWSRRRSAVTSTIAP